MFSSWLKNTNSDPDLSKEGLITHNVLGSDILVPAREDEEEALFACGCFWGTEKAFWKLPGVITTAVGYAGGNTEDPTYQEVCRGLTGHTEVVRVVWNINLISFSDLLKLFWECHDPTQGNRQGNDSGSQYRSAIYTTTTNQQDLALASRDSYQDLLTKNNYGLITTEIKERVRFFPAENYHQQYLSKPGSRPYCSAMPTQIVLEDFPGAKYKLDSEVWSHYDWSKKHCVIRCDNNPIRKVDS